MGSIIGGLIVGVVSFTGSRLLFDFPSLPKPADVLFWILGYGMTGMVIFGVTFALLARWNPKMARSGVYLVHIITLVLVLSALLAKLAIFFLSR